MKEIKPRRNPLAKERFMEGNRQKFTMILIVCMFVLLGCHVGFHIEPSVYLNFLTFIGSMFLGGASLSAWVSANKATTVNENIHQTTVTTTNTDQNSNVKVSVDTKNKNEDIKKIDINENIKEEGVNAPETKPFGQRAIGDEEEEPHDN